MKLFVTGATGFIGSHFANAAIKAGHVVTALKYGKTQPAINLPGDIIWIEGSLADANPSWFTACDLLIHFAATGVSPQKVDWDIAFQVNVIDSLNLIRTAHESGVERLVVCGSCMEYGLAAAGFDFIPANAPLAPIGSYAASKAAASIGMVAYAREKGLRLHLLRPFHVFGEGQHGENFWPSLRKAALAGQDFPMTSGEQIRDFISVEHVAGHFLRAVNRKDIIPGKPVFENVGTGHPQTLREFAEYWWKQWGATGQLLPGALPYRDNEVMRYVPDLTPVIYA